MVFDAKKMCTILKRQDPTLDGMRQLAACFDRAQDITQDTLFFLLYLGLVWFGMAWWYGPNICNYFKQNYNNINEGNFGYSILNKNAGDLGNQISRISICSQFLPQDLILTLWWTIGKYHTLFICDQSPVAQYPRLF